MSAIEGKSGLDLGQLKRETEMRVSEFQQIKTDLLADLQEKCEKVVELQIELDAVRDNYDDLLKVSSIHTASSSI